MPFEKKSIKKIIVPVSIPVDDVLAVRADRESQSCFIDVKGIGSLHVQESYDDIMDWLRAFEGVIEETT